MDNAAHELIERAVNHVRAELDDLGFLTARVDKVDVYSDGWLFSRPGHDGMWITHTSRFKKFIGEKLPGLFYRDSQIYVPRNILRKRAFRNSIRHEYGHALAELHPKLVRRSSRFV